MCYTYTHQPQCMWTTDLLFHHWTQRVRDGKKSALTHQAITLQVFYFILITKLSHAEASEDPIQRYVNIMILLKYLPQLSSSRLCLLALTTTTPLFLFKKKSFHIAGWLKLQVMAPFLQGRRHVSKKWNHRAIVRF